MKNTPMLGEIIFKSNGSRQPAGMLETRRAPEVLTFTPSLGTLIANWVWNV
jgi:hypothetical protein